MRHRGYILTAIFVGLFSGSLVSGIFDFAGLDIPWLEFIIAVPIMYLIFKRAEELIEGLEETKDWMEDEDVGI